MKLTLTRGHGKSPIPLFLFGMLFIAAAGCRKDFTAGPNSPSITVNNRIPQGYIMTPAGLMKSENVHQLAKGQSLLIQNMHAFSVHTGTLQKIEDFGEVHDAKISQLTLLNNGAGKDANHLPVTAPSGGAAGGNWVTNSQYISTMPIQSFYTSWTTPAAPVNNTGQLIYIWSGISPGPASQPLIQPVLQWGSNAGPGAPNGFGGQYWSLTNWCIVGGIGVFMPAELNIPAATNLQAVVICTGQQPDGSFNYTSSFTGYPNQTLTIIEGNAFGTTLSGAGGKYPSIPVLNNAYEVLEVPIFVNAETQYPNQPYVSMNNIQIFTGNTGPVNYPNINWTTTIGQNETLGEHTQAFPGIPGYNGGQVDLWFGPGTNYLNAQITQDFYRNNCGPGGYGSQEPYTVPYGKYNSTNSQADANTQAQNDMTANGQNYANANGTCSFGTPIGVSVSNPNVNAGYIPSVNFLDPITNAVIVAKSFNSAHGTIYVPGGTFKVMITQTNNKSLSATITGYGTQTGQTVTFTNVVVPAQGYFAGSISINNN